MKTIAAVFLTLALTGSAAAQEIRGDVSAGKRMALTACATCHLVTNDQANPALDSVPSFDALARDQAVTENRLRGFLNRPHPPMPQFDFSRQEIDDLVAYILDRRRQLR